MHIKVIIPLNSWGRNEYGINDLVAMETNKLKTTVYFLLLIVMFFSMIRGHFSPRNI